MNIFANYVAYQFQSDFHLFYLVAHCIIMTLSVCGSVFVFVGVVYIICRS